MSLNEPHGFMVALRLCTHIVMYVHHIRWMVTNFSTMTKDNITEGTNRRQQRAKKPPMARSRVKVITELGMLGPFLLFKVLNRPINTHGASTCSSLTYHLALPEHLDHKCTWQR